MQLSSFMSPYGCELKWILQYSYLILTGVLCRFRFLRTSVARRGWSLQEERLPFRVSSEKKVIMIALNHTAELCIGPGFRWIFMKRVSCATVERERIHENCIRPDTVFQTHQYYLLV